MRWIDAESAEAYLRETGRLPASARVQVRELSGGVSNLVLYVADADSPANNFVLKQARPQLRVPDPWFCSVERIWREVAVLEVCHDVLTAAAAAATDPHSSEVSITTPRVLFEDRENFLFAMTAAPPQHTVWKQLLLSGEVEPRIADRCGWLLGTLHVGTWCDSAAERRLGDQRFFRDLRIDPYYRKVAEVHPDLAEPLGRLIDSALENRLALVHGDYSPKNLLVYDGGLMLVDFEVGHFGDPAFDLGFFLSHLVLKTFRAGEDWLRFWQLTESFWQSYWTRLTPRVPGADQRDLERRAVQNFAGCVLARIDGKSQVEYLPELPLRNRIRRFAGHLLRETPSNWPAVLAVFAQS